MTRKYDSSWWLMRAALALILAFVVGAAVGCSNSSNSVNPGTDKPPTAPNSPVNNDDKGVVDQGGSSGNNGTNSGTGGTGTDHGGGAGTGTNHGSNTPTPSEPSNPSSEPSVVAENEAFRIYAPAENAVVGTTFKVSGEARVFEAAFSYSFEDGHNVLAEGHVMADQGAPEWGKFEFEVTFKDATSPSGILIIYESSAQDGSRIHQLEIPVQFADGVVKPVAEAE
jgi:hypothetical protein